MVDFSHIIIFSKYLRGWDAVNGPSYTTQKARTFFTDIGIRGLRLACTPNNGIKPTLRTAWASNFIPWV